MQGLPPLARSPTSPTGAISIPSVLPPLRGGAVGLQASRALGGQPGVEGGTGHMPGAIIPRRLPTISPPAALSSIPEGKGKGPSNGLPKVKKSPHASSDEDVSGGEGPPRKVFSPLFSPTRSLPPLGPLGINTPLPSIGGPGGRLSQIRRPTSTIEQPPLSSMASRRISTDPFSSEPLSSIRPGPLSPTRTGPLSPTRTGPLRPSIARSPPVPLSPPNPEK